MGFHLAALYRSLPVSTGYSEMTPITDADLAVNPATSRFWSSKDALILGAYAAGANLAKARVYTPWQLPSHVRPFNAAILPNGNPGVANWLDQPMLIPATHDIIVDANQSGGSPADTIALLFLTTQGLTRAPAGSLQTVRGDVSGASPGVRTWSEITVTWEYSLAPGDYAIVGSECVSTNGIAHRWMLEGSSCRPGGISQGSLTNLPSSFQMGGNLGAWGTFSSPLMPRLEVLCNAADATHSVFLQVIAL